VTTNGEKTIMAESLEAALGIIRNLKALGYKAKIDGNS
jgi:hypothetical protein